VMVLLLITSFMSWWYIFRKLFVIREAMRQSDEFENVFWKGTDLNALFQSAAGSRHTAGSMERIFEAGFREFM
jgi:biopolymer transport protein TolQ